jgi:hypothetical protein
MPRRPATITQADVARVIRAAKAAGAAAVELKLDGTLVIRLIQLSPETTDTPVVLTKEIVL